MINERTLIVFAGVGTLLFLGRKATEPYRSLLGYGSLAVLAVTRVLPPLAAVAAAGVAGLFHLGNFISRKRNAASIHDYVQEKGVRVEEVERDLPFTSSRGQHQEIRRGRTTQYSIPRLGSSAPEHWEFLMRTKKDGAQYPQGFLFRSEGGEPPAEMAELLRRIAKASDQEYLEFEANASEVSAYWDAWGGTKQFDRIHDLMQRLAAF